jgi:hypothetical protein
MIARLGERISRLRPQRRRAAPPREIAPEFTMDELAEFLEADLHPDTARPEFREKLREELWALVREKYGTDERDE